MMSTVRQTSAPQSAGSGAIIVAGLTLADLAALENVVGPSTLVVPVASAAEALAVIGREDASVLVAGASLPDRTGIELFAEAVELAPGVGRILVLSEADPDLLLAAVNVGRVHRVALNPTGGDLVATILDVADSLGGSAGRNPVVDEVLAANARLERLVRDLRRALREQSYDAIHDGLTGLYNHRFFQEALRKALARADRNGTRLALLFADVDHFKHYNDTQGHVLGDEVLRRVAALLGGEDVEAEARPRAADIVARYGGEEFVVVLPDTGREGALAYAERLRDRVARHRFPGEAAQPSGSLTMSIGVAVYPDDATAQSELIGRADAALYAAKSGGRNCVRSADGVPQGRTLG